MQSPHYPHSEEARLATLHSLEVLDTPAEDRFDRYTRLCQRIFGMPIALISLVDRYRQWFKSKQGLDVAETSRDISFCGHAILNDEVFEIRNARRDPRFRNNPLVVDQPHIRFYAGAPLIAPSGHKLGTLCIIDRVPRWLEDDEKKILADMADMVVGELTNFIDIDSGAISRSGLRTLGAKAVLGAKPGTPFHLMLFDISQMLADASGETSQCAWLKSFTRLLRDIFPGAELVAHMGGGNFAVMHFAFHDSDVVEAVKDVEASAAAALPSGRAAATHIHVGDIRGDRARHTSIDVLIREADQRFLQHTLGNNDRAH